MKINDLPEEIQKVLIEKSEEMSKEMAAVDDLLDMDAWNTPITEVCDSLVQVNESLLRIAKINLAMMSVLTDYVKNLAVTEANAPGYKAGETDVAGQ